MKTSEYFRMLILALIIAPVAFISCPASETGPNNKTDADKTDTDKTGMQETSAEARINAIRTVTEAFERTGASNIPLTSFRIEGESLTKAKGASANEHESDILIEFDGSGIFRRQDTQEGETSLSYEVYDDGSEADKVWAYIVRSYGETGQADGFVRHFSDRSEYYDLISDISLTEDQVRSMVKDDDNIYSLTEDDGTVIRLGFANSKLACIEITHPYDNTIIDTGLYSYTFNLHVKDYGESISISLPEDSKITDENNF